MLGSITDYEINVLKQFVALLKVVTTTKMRITRKMLDLQFSILKEKTKLPLRYDMANENMHTLQIVLDRQAGKGKNISHAMKKRSFYDMIFGMNQLVQEIDDSNVRSS